MQRTFRLCRSPGSRVDVLFIYVLRFDFIERELKAIPYISHFLIRLHSSMWCVHIVESPLFPLLCGVPFFSQSRLAGMGGAESVVKNVDKRTSRREHRTGTEREGEKRRSGWKKPKTGNNDFRIVYKIVQSVFLLYIFIVIMCIFIVFSTVIILFWPNRR